MLNLLLPPDADAAFAALAALRVHRIEYTIRMHKLRKIVQRTADLAQRAA
jgi:hypothetical protein